jgi:hypothetical protein
MVGRIKGTGAYTRQTAQDGQFAGRLWEGDLDNGTSIAGRVGNFGVTYLIRAIASLSRLYNPLKKCATGFASAELPLISRHWQSQWHSKSCKFLFFNGLLKVVK